MPISILSSLRGFFAKKGHEAKPPQKEERLSFEELANRIGQARRPDYDLTQTSGEIGAIVERLKRFEAFLAKKEFPHEMPGYRIAVEHQRNFLLHLRSSMTALAAIGWRGDYAEISRSRDRLKHGIASLTKAASDNRYLYAFMQDGLNEFNATMKQLISVEEELSNGMREADAHYAKKTELKAKAESLGGKREKAARLAEQKKGVEAEAARLSGQLAEADKYNDEKTLAEKTSRLNAAKQSLQDARGLFFSFLGTTRRAMKMYAHEAKEKNEAKLAERYSSDADAFVRDCLEKPSGVKAFLQRLAMAARQTEASAFAGALDANAARLSDAEKSVAALEEEVAGLEARASEARNLRELLEARRKESAETQASIISLRQAIQDDVTAFAGEASAFLGYRVTIA